MRKTQKKGLLCYQFHLIQGFSDQIEHAIFTREGGVSKKPYDSLNLSYEVGDDPKAVSENRRRILMAMGCELGISVKQTHSKKVAIIDEKSVSKFAFTAQNPISEIENFDGMITNLKEIGLMVKIADCQAILFFDPVTQVLAVAHAGWRGLAKDINGQIIGIMQERFGCSPGNIFVGVSPSIGPENTYFTDPYNELPHSFHPFIKNSHYVDLWSFCQNQLEYYGILPQKMEFSRICTMNDNGPGRKFYSYRRDKGITGRFALMAYLK